MELGKFNITFQWKLFICVSLKSNIKRRTFNKRKSKKNQKKMSHQNFTNLTNQTFPALHHVVEARDQEEDYQYFVSNIILIILHFLIFFQWTNLFHRYFLGFWLVSIPYTWWALVLLDHCVVLLTLPNLQRKKKKPKIVLKCIVWYERCLH